MKVNLWYPGLMAIAGLVVGLMLTTMTSTNPQDIFTNYYITWRIIPSVVAFFIVGWLWGSWGN